MKIGNVDLNHKVLLVAEIGNNHEGDVELAERLIYLAAEAGADVAKFQTITPPAASAHNRYDKIKSTGTFCT